MHLNYPKFLRKYPKINSLLKLYKHLSLNIRSPSDFAVSSQVQNYDL